MFKKPLLFSGILLLFVITLVTLSLFRNEKKGQDAFQKLTEKLKSKKNGLLYTETQRQDVVKEIWYREKESAHMRVVSKESALFFFNEGKNIEVVEQMVDVDCLAQEKIFYISGKPMQEVRHIVAKKACYNYSTNIFVAADVLLTKYQLEGHALPKSVDQLKPTMQGKAESVEFTFKGDKLDVKAHKFKANFDPKKGML